MSFGTTNTFPGSTQQLDDAQQVDDFVNNSGTTVAVGEVLMIDSAVPHFSGYRSLVTPTAAKLDTGDFWLVIGLGTAGTGVDGTIISAQQQGVLSANLAANSGTGAELAAAAGVKTLTSTLIGGRRVLGHSRETGAGVKIVYFNGKYGGTAAGGLNTTKVTADEIYVGTTTPLVAGTLEIASGSLCVNKSWDAADSGGDLIGWFDWIPPKRWNAGTVAFQVDWSIVAATAGPVVFSIAGGAVSDADTLALTLGSEVTMTDSSSATANLHYLTPESAACTIGGTPAKADLVKFRIMRTSGAAGDTLAGTARILGVRVLWTADADTDV